MLVWLNGKLTERDRAVVCAFDAGLQHGIGLFETFAAHHGAVFRAEAHTRRLAESARELLLTESLRADPLAAAVALVVDRNGLESARVRLTLTGGNLNLLAEGRRRVDPTILIDAHPPTAYPDAFFERGVMVTIADGRENPLAPMAGHKTLNYWPRIHALQLAIAKKAGETLWFTVANHLAGGSVSNVFLVANGRLQTPIARGEDPATPSCVLPGITRAAIEELADDLGIETAKGMLDIDDLLGADEVFLTNSSWGVLPVVAVERQKIGGGEVGEMTRRLRAAWLDLVEQETTAGS
ncbi:MAG: aminotransferase class IV [Planctomycetota bacterium]|jgi:branched-subunit amino acid aminotransferase/4-amino-4-deoxychorismate lyase